MVFVTHSGIGLGINYAAVNLGVLYICINKKYKKQNM